MLMPSVQHAEGEQSWLKLDILPHFYFIQTIFPAMEK
jgi:hypothetical protein